MFEIVQLFMLCLLQCCWQNLSTFRLLEILSLLWYAPSRLNCGIWFAFIAASNTFIVLALRGWV